VPSRPSGEGSTPLGPPLPLEWDVASIATGGVRFHIRQEARPTLVAVPAALAVAWLALIVRAAMRGSVLPLGISQPLAISLDVAVAAFATWCAFAVETWEVGGGRFEHRLAFGPWARLRRYVPGTFIIQTTTDNHGWPYHRLFLVDDKDRAQWVMDRNAAQLRAIAKFLSFHTGWPVAEDPPLDSAS
jgi:hypothetical protein